MKISFIVPIYNSEKFLDECIKSIINQTYTKWELILVNDGSTDNSEDICLSYMKCDSRIKYYKKKNGGVSSARNFGIDNSSGEFLTFIDSDDFIEPEYADIMIKKMNDDVDLVVCGLKKYLKDKSVCTIAHRLYSGVYFHKDIEKIVIDDGTMSGFTFHSSCSILFRTESINKYNIRFNEKLKFNEDGLFVTQYYLYSDKKKVSINFDKEIYFYRDNSESAVSNININDYIENMKIIRGVLLQDNNAIVKEQVYKRKVTTTVELFSFLAKQKNLEYNFVKQELNSLDFQRGVSILKIKEQKPSKKLLLYLFKLRLNRIVYLLFYLRSLKLCVV